ncbi:MAG: methylated-DNA--[protein]-cysteine S-methyltransferase [Gemmatimonadales bacterium]|nr:methylated-DNA--[protein]-cysteine S-methyltransferase [Gemmatimonadales bacterium]
MPASDADRIADAIAFLQQHYRRQPSLDEAAAAVGLSPYHFQRLFRRWAGVSPKRFLQYLTIEHARAALDEGRSLLETSYDAGLSGPGRLHDLFVTFDAVTPGQYKARGAGLSIDYGFIPTPFGEGFVAQTERGVCGLAFVDAGGRAGVLDDYRSRFPGARFRPAPTAADRTGRLIFRPRRPPQRLILDLRGSNFQIKVWEALLRIVPGTLASYGDVAAAIGQPEATRAVASAVARNPVSYLIPCHRVIRSSGAFGDYRWGAARKKTIVAWEAARRDAGLPAA